MGLELSERPIRRAERENEDKVPNPGSRAAHHSFIISSFMWSCSGLGAVCRQKHRAVCRHTQRQ